MFEYKHFDFDPIGRCYVTSVNMNETEQNRVYAQILPFKYHSIFYTTQIFWIVSGFYNEVVLSEFPLSRTIVYYKMDKSITIDYNVNHNQKLNSNLFL